MNASVANTYDAWKADYLKSAISGGYYIHGADTDDQGKGTSESHGYGMIITALMAGYDRNAKTYYDGLWQFQQSQKSY